MHDATAVNYHEWQVCRPAIIKGSGLGLPVYKYLKDPLMRKFGEEWYEKLEAQAVLLNKK